LVEPFTLWNRAKNPRTSNTGDAISHRSAFMERKDSAI
jgi:hypothetical protein